MASHLIQGKQTFHATKNVAATATKKNTGLDYITLLSCLTLTTHQEGYYFQLRRPVLLV